MNGGGRSSGSLLRELFTTLEAWISGQIRIVLILSLLYAIGFALLGMPAWWAVALVCGFLNLVPLIGSVIALALSAGVGWLAELGPERLLGVLGVYVFVQALEGFYLTPKILGKRLSMPPWAVFLALLGGGLLFGPLGILFAVPAVALLLVVWRFMRRP